jgi:hypothetical protein
MPQGEALFMKTPVKNAFLCVLAAFVVPRIFDAVIYSRRLRSYAFWRPLCERLGAGLKRTFARCRDIGDFNRARLSAEPRMADGG